MTATLSELRALADMLKPYNFELEHDLNPQTLSVEYDLFNKSVKLKLLELVDLATARGLNDFMAQQYLSIKLLNAAGKYSGNLIFHGLEGVHAKLLLDGTADTTAQYEVQFSFASYTARAVTPD